MDDLFDLYRDILTTHGHTLCEFSKRKLAVLSEPLRFFPANSEDVLEKLTSDFIGENLPQVKGWNDSIIHLLDATVYPVSLVEKIYRPSSKPGWNYELEELRPVPYRLLNYSTGRLRIEDVDEDGNCLGTYHDPDPISYVTYRGHLLRTIPDTWGGPMRAVLFWWLFSTMDRDWWARFLERFGSPFLEGTYTKGDDESRYLLERAFSAATKILGIAVPEGTSIQTHTVNTQGGGDAFEKFHSTANSEISKIMVGQNLSAEGQNLGLGGGQAGVQENVRQDIRQFDANELSAIVQNSIIAPLLRLNQITHAPTKIAWGGSDEAKVDTTSDTIQAAHTAGLRLTDEGLEVFNKTTGLTFERNPIGQVPLSSPAPRALAAKPPRDPREAIDQIAEKAAPEQAEAFAKMAEPIRQEVLAATSLADLESRLKKRFQNLDHGTAVDLAQDALTGSALNALTA